jgi:O-antigen/teichoic acid export membrane protein
MAPDAPLPIDSSRAEGAPLPLGDGGVAAPAGERGRATGQPSLHSRAVTSFSWSVAAKIISQGATFIGTLMLARILPVADFGLFAMGQVYLGFLQQFLDAGFLQALIQRPKLTQAELAGSFWLLLVGGFVGFGGSVLARPLLDSLFGTPGIGLIIVVQSSILLFLPFRTIAQAILSRDVRIEELSKREVVLSVLRVGASIWLALHGAGVWSLILPQIGVEMAFSLSCYRCAGWRLTGEFSWSTLRPLMSFGVNITASRILWFAANRADQFLVGRLLGPNALGLYSLAWQFAGALPQFASATLSRVAFPLFARLQEDAARLRGAFLALTRYTGFVAVPAFAGLAMLAPDLFAALLKPTWRSAVLPLQVLCPFALLNILMSLGAFLINARGRTGRNLIFNFLSLLMTVIGVSVGAKLGGLTGVTVMVGLSSIPVAFLFIRSAMTECGGTVGQWAAVLARPVLATLAMCAGVTVIGLLLRARGPVLRLASMGSSGIILYVGAVLVLAPGIFAEIRNRHAG